MLPKCTYFKLHDPSGHKYNSTLEYRRDLVILSPCKNNINTLNLDNYGQYINKFPPNTIKVIREFERTQKKICRHKMSIMFNEICIKKCCQYIYIYIYFQKKQRNRSHRIINLFQSCYAFLKLPKTRKKINGTSSDLFDRKKYILSSADRPFRSIRTLQCG